MVWLLNLWFLFWYFDFRYWLYAAAKLKCLLVTNDEMRDHIFELLSNSFFQKWKERHQVRFTFVKGCLKLEMPPPFSVVIQVSYNLISNFDVLLFKYTFESVYLIFWDVNSGIGEWIMARSDHVPKRWGIFEKLDLHYKAEYIGFTLFVQVIIIIHLTNFWRLCSRSQFSTVRCENSELFVTVYQSLF